MKLLITGGAGFLGARLARELLAKGELCGGKLTQLVLADQFPAPADLAADPRVEVLTGPLLDQCAGFVARQFDGVFHLASAVSGECEADFDLGMRSNLDSTRALLDALRAAGNKPRVLFSSSVAVYGPDPAHPLPDVVTDDTFTTPQTSYGSQKLMCEYMVADFSRKGFIDGRSARLMSVSVRPGKPNGAASSFFSGIIREPLAGIPSVCPVSPDVLHPMASPRSTIESLIKVYECTREAYGGRTALNLPGLDVTVQEMLDALERVAGPKVRALVTFQRDERIAGIVSRWAKGSSSKRANSLGLFSEKSFDDIIRQYIADCQAGPNAATALKGMQ